MALNPEAAKTPILFQGEELSLSLIEPGLRAAIRACVTGEKPWPLFVWGPPGTGKTCAAGCLLHSCKLPSRHFTEKRPGETVERVGIIPAAEGKYFTLLQLWEELNDATFGRIKLRPAQYRQVCLKTPPLVVIDEVGAGVDKSASKAYYDALKWSWDDRKNKPLIFISNLNLSQLGKIFDGPMVSRLGSGTPVELKGKDRRI